MDINIQLKELTKGCEEILPENALREKLLLSQKEKRPLRVKLGIDASGPDVHLGFTIVLRKLKQFQDLGHTAILIIGDFTGKIGDPSGKNKTRPQLTDEQIEKNIINYKNQVYRILDKEKTIIRFNGEWLDKLSPQEVVKLTSKFTVARMLERDYFHKRYQEGIAISIHEFLYPLFQAYDSVATKADIEIGGTDQKFNLILGRNIQEEYGIKPQVVMTMPILEGIDGIRKMSKSYGNYIGITHTPAEMFGRTMSIPDTLILKYFKMITNISENNLTNIENRLKKGENPRNLKVELAKSIIAMYHSEDEAQNAENEFNRVFKKGGIPDNIPEKQLEQEKEYPLLSLLNDLNLTESNSESRRMIKQGAVKINGQRIDDANYIYIAKKEDIIQVGKRKFTKII